MKVIHRSIFIELILTFLLCLVSLNFVLMMEKLLRLSRSIAGVGASVVDLSKIILLLQPQLLLLTIPMALLLSTLLIYGRLNLDNEIIIFRASGMKFLSISFPVLLLALSCFLLNLFVSFYLGPKSSTLLRTEITEIIRERTPLAFEEGKFNTSFKNAMIFVRDKKADNSIRGVFIYDNRNKNNVRVLVAKKGEIASQDDVHINFSLYDGYIHMVKGENTTELLFKRYNMLLKLDYDMPSVKRAELTPFQLIDTIREQDTDHRVKLYLELHRRLSLPLLCLILAFFGTPLAMMSGKTGKLGGLTLGLTVFTFYYILLIYGENLSKSGSIPHYIGAWFPTAVLILSSFFLFRRENRK